MIVIVNETNHDYKITRDGCNMLISRKLRKTETGVFPPIMEIAVNGLDEKLDEMYKLKTYLVAAAGKTTKVLMTIADAVTTYTNSKNGIVVRAITREEQSTAKKSNTEKDQYMRSCVIVLSDSESKTRTISVCDTNDCTGGTVRVRENSNTGEKAHIVFIKSAKWEYISHKKVTIKMHEKKTVHLSYVTIQKDGKDVNINAVIRVDANTNPIGKPINRKPTNIKKPTRGGKKPYGKKPYNKNNNGNRKPYTKDGKQGQNGYKKPYNKDGKSNSGGYKSSYGGKKYHGDKDGQRSGQGGYKKPFSTSNKSRNIDPNRTSSSKTFSKPKNYNK